MDITIFFKGLLLGFVLAMSVGPIALLCISNTISRGTRFGFAVGFGAATADAIYGVVAGFGATLLVTFMSDYDFILKIIGGSFLLYLGVKIMRSAPSHKKLELRVTELIKTYFAIVGLTLINPITIATYMGAFVGMGLGNTNGDLSLSLILGLGILIGSILWHSTLVLVSSFLKERITKTHLMKLNKVSGLILCLFGLFAGLSLFLT
jgi:threonine/homoserine/homoserine lactone efflux protein